MIKGNSSDWIIRGVEAGVSLDFLKQNKLEVVKACEMLGLPTPKVYTLNHEEITPKKISKLFNGKNYFCRLVPNDFRKPRLYMLNINTAQEFWEFVSEYDLKDYKIMLKENGNITQSGGIISDEQNNVCIAELVQGYGASLFHGDITPTTAICRFTKKLEFIGVKSSDEEKTLLIKALRHIGWPRHPFPGYYEFDVLDRTQIMFRNYQEPSSAFARLY